MKYYINSIIFKNQKVQFNTVPFLFDFAAKTQNSNFFEEAAGLNLMKIKNTKKKF